jgi:hypothetical protein
MNKNGKKVSGIWRSAIGQMGSYSVLILHISELFMPTTICERSVASRTPWAVEKGVATDWPNLRPQSLAPLMGKLTALGICSKTP